MATVYLAHDLRHDRPVALKVLHDHLAASLGPERFLREIRFAAQLQHPHILPVFDSGDADGVLWYTMPFVEGESLRERLERDGQLPIDESIRLLGEVADALAKAHRLGIVHRDIKPENILLADGHALVADFGVAKPVGEMAGSASGLTSAGMSLGTPAYMAPEQVAADPAADHRVDLYALGTVGWEMLTGVTPFGHLPPAQMLAAHLTIMPEPAATKRPDCPPALDAALAACLAKAPADRPESAEALRSMLVETTGPVAATGEGAVAAPSATPRRIAIGVALAVLAGVAVWSFAGREAAAEERTLAVIPFINLQGDAESEYFSDGVSEEILRAVSRLDGIRVVSRSVSFQYRGRDVDVRRVGRELGVSHVLGGTLQRAGTSVRVSVELTEARSGFNAWSERYDRELTDIFVVEDEIARAVAQALDLRLAGGGPAREANVEAHDRYLLGLAAVNRRDIAAAARHFEAAVGIDSSYARALGGLAMTRALEPEWSRISPDSTVPIARRLAERAIALDSTESRAWEALGYVRLTYDWDLAGAESAFRTAARADPLAMNARQWLGLTLTAARRHAEAREALREAMVLDPEAAAIEGNYAIALQAGGWPDARQGRDSAIAHLRRALSLPSGADVFLYQYYLAHLLVLQESYVEAEVELRAAGRLVGDATAYLPLLEGRRRPESRDAALRLLGAWSKSPATSRLPLVFLAGWYTLLDDPAAALDLLERGAGERAPFMTYLDGVGLVGLDGDPRYGAVRAQVGLPLGRE